MTNNFSDKYKDNNITNEDINLKEDKFDLLFSSRHFSSPLRVALSKILPLLPLRLVYVIPSSFQVECFLYNTNDNILPPLLLSSSAFSSNFTFFSHLLASSIVPCMHILCDF